jgi:GNAT superfamily N-acetyltransferase
VQELFRDDPGVVTLSFHESGRYLFPGTGFLTEFGQGAAAGTAVNVTFEPETGEFGWLTAVESVLPWVAAGFGPDLVVSQHGCDTHAWDPLAHLRVTTTAMGAAARLVDRIAHRWAGGRWLATGGGGYDAYRVVPRAWSLVWLAGAHRELPAETSEAWRARWLTEAARYGQAPLPETFDDAPNAGLARDSIQREAEDTSIARLALVFGIGTPSLFLRASVHRWLDPLWAADDSGGAGSTDSGGSPAIVAPLTGAGLAGLTLAHRVLPMADPRQGLELLRNSLGASDPGHRGEAVAAVVGDRIVGVAIAGPSEREVGQAVLAVGVAPAYRRRGIGTELLRVLAEQVRSELWAIVGVGERDPFEPLDRELRATIARRLFERAGFAVEPAGGNVARIDAQAIQATRGGA